MLVFEYTDRPGVIGNVGRILGDAAINIGGMQVSRQEDRAIGVLNVDSAVPPALAAELSDVVDAKTFTAIDLHD
jgi:D-3-phosphoglycerate dehydrogenase